MNDPFNLFRQFFGFKNFDFSDENEKFRESERGDDAWTDEIDSFANFSQFFQRQMSDLFENFGMLDRPSFFGSDIEVSPPSDSSVHESDIRSYLLKPGYENTIRGKQQISNARVDSDLDERINPGQLGDLLQEKDIDKHSQKPKVSFFSKSIITRTVRRPDGTVVTERIERDQDGNEKTTVTEHTSDDDNIFGITSTPKDPFFPFSFFK